MGGGMAVKGRAWQDLKVGAFVLAGLAMCAVAIFLIGDERRLFSRSVDFHTKFTDVQGLKGGAPVRMGGIDIGHVANVGYGKNPQDTTIYVDLDIVESEAGRIKTDCTAQIATKGLLGDKMIEVTKGTAKESVKPGGQIPGAEPDDILKKVNSMGDKAEAALENIRKVTESLADDKFQRDLREMIGNINTVTQQIAGGDGYPHRFLTDKNEAERISRTLDDLGQTSHELNATLRDTRNVIARVEQGPGFAHEVIYGGGPQKQVEQFGNAANEIALTLKGVRESDSLVHDAMYGGKGDGAQALANITAITADLRVIVAGVKDGKGTIGALLVDPSVYEDMKVVLGNVERNDVLRALVRYSIKQDEKKPGVQVGESGSSKPH
jgi:phospholipid/cholesterol/gamma-HCH transport system substrate-binding protein